MGKEKKICQGDSLTHIPSGDVNGLWKNMLKKKSSQQLPQLPPMHYILCNCNCDVYFFLPARTLKSHE